MAKRWESTSNIPRSRFDFVHQPKTEQSFENALQKARNGRRLTVDDGVELLTTGTDKRGIDRHRKERILEAADYRRAGDVGEEVTFVANLNNNVTTACDTGCLFCNFKNGAEKFEVEAESAHDGFTKSPEESRAIVEDAISTGIYEVCSVSGLHPAFVLNDEHREILETEDSQGNNYKPAEKYTKSPGTYEEQIAAMSVGNIHVHSMTPEEAYHARRGTNWNYETVYTNLKQDGLDSVPGTAAEILVDEVREIICPEKIGSSEWLTAMEAAAAVGLDMTATIMYGHVENEKHRIMHLNRIRELQDRTNSITEFVPLSFVHQNTPLANNGLVTSGATTSEDELMIAVSRLFLDNIENIQSSWVKYGDEQGLKMLSCGANDFMGTILSEEITKRAGGDFGEFRSFREYTEMITNIGRIPVERSTDYREKRRIEPDDTPIGPTLGPKADGTPLTR